MSLTRFVLCGVVTGGLAISSDVARPQAMDGQTHEHLHAPAGDAHRHDHGTVQADLAIQPQAGQRAVLAFTLTDKSGEPIDDLITHHARKLHVVIISDDMQVIGHVHPQDFAEPIEDGQGKVYFAFPRAGRDLVAADIMTEAEPHTEQFFVEVAEGAELRAEAAAPPAVAVVNADEGDRYTAPVVLDGADRARGYEVSLARPDRIEAGEPATFTFRVARGGAPVTDLRPYLDAPLHPRRGQAGFRRVPA